MSFDHKKSLRLLNHTFPTRGTSNITVETIFTYNPIMQGVQQLPYVWDYDLDQSQFLAILEGRETKGRLNQDWAACRLLEYAPYEEIIRLFGFRRLVENWSRWRGRRQLPRAGHRR